MIMTVIHKITDQLGDEEVEAAVRQLRFEAQV